MKAILPVFIVLLLLLNSCAHSNFDVSGVVVSKHKKPLEHAAVIADRFNDYDTVYTDSLGRFTIEVFEGGFKLKGKSYARFYKQGYKKKKKTVWMNKKHVIKLRRKL